MFSKTLFLQIDVTGYATIALVFVGIITLIIQGVFNRNTLIEANDNAATQQDNFIKQLKTENANALLNASVALINQYDKNFEEDLAENRAGAANYIKSTLLIKDVTKQQERIAYLLRNQLAGVYDLFDGMGFLIQKKAINEEFIHHYFSYYYFRYYQFYLQFDCRRIGIEVNGWENTIWDSLGFLAVKMNELECRQAGGRDMLQNNLDLNKFFDDESHLLEFEQAPL